MTASAPLVTVVIPAYNAERTVSATVGSVLAQTVGDLEVIGVDDGSSDDTAAEAQRSGDARLRVVTQPNAGAAAARNTGIDAGRARYVAFVDADDLWLPHKLERQIAVLEGDPGATAVQSGAIWVDPELNVLSVRPCVEPRDPLLATLLFQNLPAFPTTLVVERSAFSSIGRFDPSLVILEDWELAIRAARYGGLRSVPEPLALYRVHPGNRSRELDIHIDPGFRVLERLFSDPELPEPIRRRRRQVYGTFYRMLSGGAFKVGRWRDCGRWAARSLATDPRQIAYMSTLPLRRIQRARSRSRARHLDVPGSWSAHGVGGGESGKSKAEGR
jgi:glycosyltransferase involved in cell wall biosynthesis